MSDRPGVATAAAGQTVVEVEREARSSATAGKMQLAKGANYLEYLSALCAGLNECLRTGPARGLDPRSMIDLQFAYRERCLEEDIAARKRLLEDLTRSREAHDSEVAAEKRERDRVVQSREQCDEMYRILHGRRKKIDTMSVGERADFDRFEANWKSGCGPA